MHLVAVIIP